MANKNYDLFDHGSVLGHPSGLFVLFFTEMWERFSYYGMRAILVLFLVSSMGLGGWDWPREDALALYGTYTSLVYLTPILGGFLADKYLGYRWAVVIGALIMTLGHASMAIESNHMFLYIGIGLLIVGNGFFKPNMTSIISNMYADYPEKKDGAYTIFYMGVNAGAFLGILLCGYLGEKYGWSYGFGLAGIFMLLGTLQFYLAQNIFGDIGTTPNATEREEPKLEFDGDRLNHFTMMDKILIAVCAVAGFIWVINDPLSKIADNNILKFGAYDASNDVILGALVLFLVLLVSRISRYPRIIRDRMIAIVVFAVFTVIFWASFEQAGGSMTIFAKDYTNRVMTGGNATLFNIVNIIITVVPVGIISWVLYLLFKQTFAKYRLANLVLASSFIFIWFIVGWMINRDLKSSAYVVNYSKIETEKYGYSKISAAGDTIKASATAEELTKLNGQTTVTEKNDKDEEVTYTLIKAEQQINDSTTISAIVVTDTTKEYTPVTGATTSTTGLTIVQDSVTIREPLAFENNASLVLFDSDKKGTIKYLREDKAAKLKNEEKIEGTVIRKKGKEVEIAASWFSILNSLFIIIFAPLFSKWWESKYNPSASSKYGLGLILLGVGFAALAFGSMGIEKGASAAAVSIIWLILAYLFHTLGELCLSPVALSYISKLVPGRMIAFMFGIWYVAIAIGNKLAGKMGSMIDQIQEAYSMSGFFLIFTLIPIGLGVIGVLISPLIKKLMHGVK